MAKNLILESPVYMASQIADSFLRRNNADDVYRIALAEKSGMRPG